MNSARPLLIIGPSIRKAEIVGHSLQRPTQLTVAHNHEMDVRQLGSYARGGAEKEIVRLDGHEAGHDTYQQSIRLYAQLCAKGTCPILRVEKRLQFEPERDDFELLRPPHPKAHDLFALLGGQ